jgi:hypothetical protein
LNGFFVNVPYLSEKLSDHVAQVAVKLKKQKNWTTGKFHYKRIMDLHTINPNPQEK